MHKWIQIALIFLFPFIVSAQQSMSNNGRFSIEFARGCAPMTVNIIELDTLGNVPRQYSYFEGSGITSSTTFTYHTIGNYRIVQTIDGILDDTLSIEVTASLPQEVLITKCDNFEILVQSLDTYYDSVRIYFGGADSITLLPDQITSYQFNNEEIQTYALKGLFTNADEICQITIQETTPIAQIRSPSILSASVKETCTDIYSLYLSLDSVQEEVNYSILLSQTNSTTVYDGFLNATDLVFGNISFELSDYCIQVQVSDPCNDTVIESNSFCSTPSNLSLSPFETLYSTYEGSSIYINLDPVSSGFFEIRRRLEGGNFEARGSQIGSFNDPIGSSARKYFYQINYTDSCGSVLFSAETHPPLIEAEKIQDNYYEVFFISAQNSLNSLTGANYQVGNNGAFASGDVSSNSFQISLDASNGAPRQQLSVQSNYGSGLQLMSNTLDLKYELIVYVPNAFTPNGDGLNDKLEFFGAPTENTSVKIYSQWGQTIYQSTNLTEGWDGRISGSIAPAGNYLYEILFETSEGEKLRQRGTFVVIIN
ncbi:MAG: gliding motility-associated C-terminal domain-containing protein [Bacteroidota bacterium]